MVYAQGIASQGCARSDRSRHFLQGLSRPPQVQRTAPSFRGRFTTTDKHEFGAALHRIAEGDVTFKCGIRCKVRPELCHEQLKLLPMRWMPIALVLQSNHMLRLRLHRMTSLIHSIRPRMRGAELQSRLVLGSVWPRFSDMPDVNSCPVVWPLGFFKWPPGCARCRPHSSVNVFW